MALFRQIILTDLNLEHFCGAGYKSRYTFSIKNKTINLVTLVSQQPFTAIFYAEKKNQNQTHIVLNATLLEKWRSRDLQKKFSFFKEKFHYLPALTQTMHIQKIIQRIQRRT